MPKKRGFLMMAKVKEKKTRKMGILLDTHFLDALSCA